MPSTSTPLEPRAALLEALVAASVDGIVAADMKGRILLFNPAAERIFGRRAADVVGKMNVRALYPGDTARQVMRMLRSPDHGGPGRLEPVLIDILDAQGNRVPVQLTAAILYEDGREVATFGIFCDLRQRLQLKARWERALEAFRPSEREALLLELGGSAAHALNQPLTSILTAVALLERALARGELGAAEPLVRRTAGLIRQEAERMANIVKRIGRLSRYSTTSYVGAQRIIDLEAAGASEDASPHGSRPRKLPASPPPEQAGPGQEP